MKKVVTAAFCLIAIAMLAVGCSDNSPEGVVKKVYQRHVLFDHDYDDTDTTRMYCTELVVFALHRAGFDVSHVKRHELSLPVLHANCMFPSDVYKLPFLKTIGRF